MTLWDFRAMMRALGASMLGLAVVWLVTAASDEGQLTVGARAGRTLPLAPLVGAVGVALALGTSRVRQEARAFEALGRSPTETGRAAALGAALPSIVIALAIVAIPSVDVGAFYPRAASGDSFVRTNDAFLSPTLGVRIDDDGETYPIDGPVHGPDEGLPRGARASAAAATGLAGLSLPLIAARASLRRSLLDRQRRRRMRAVAVAETIGCALLALIAFQAAAAHLAPAALAVAPPLALLAAQLAKIRLGHAASRQSPTRDAT